MILFIPTNRIFCHLMDWYASRCQTEPSLFSVEQLKSELFDFRLLPGDRFSEIEVAEGYRHQPHTCASGTLWVSGKPAWLLVSVADSLCWGREALSMAFDATGYREDVEQARRRFAEFRQVHAGRSRLPEELWATAAKLARRDGITATARVLGVDRPSLQKWTDRLEPRASIKPPKPRNHRRRDCFHPAAYLGSAGAEPVEAIAW
jgi:hypothetical protein